MTPRPEQRSREAAPAAAPRSPLAAAHRLYGWGALAVFLLLGTALEALNGFKTSAYLLDPLRREFWILAHFHGAFLALLNILYAGSAEATSLGESRARAASRALLAGSVLLPLGFFLGGLVHYEGDPGIGIVLVPIGALLVLYAAAVQAVVAWPGRPRR